MTFKEGENRIESKNQTFPVIHFVTGQKERKKKKENGKKNPQNNPQKISKISSELHLNFT